MAEAERIIGTPDSPRRRAAGAGAGADAARPRGRRRIAVLFAVAVFAYALDLVSKMIVVAKLEHHEPIEIVGDWLQVRGDPERGRRLRHRRGLHRRSSR